MKTQRRREDKGELERRWKEEEGTGARTGLRQGTGGAQVGTGGHRCGQVGLR